MLWIDRAVQKSWGVNFTCDSGKLQCCRFRKSMNQTEGGHPLLEEPISPSALSPAPATASIQVRDPEGSTQ